MNTCTDTVRCLFLAKFNLKIKKIFIPFLFTSAMVIVVFYAVIWLLIMKAKLPLSPYMVYLLIASIVIPALVSVLLFRPRLWVLQKSYAGYASNYSLYNICMFTAIALPMILTSAYVEDYNFGFIVLALISYGVCSGIVFLMLMFSKLHVGYSSMAATTFSSYMASLLKRYHQYRNPVQLPVKVTFAKWKHRKRKNSRKRRNF